MKPFAHDERRRNSGRSRRSRSTSEQWATDYNEIKDLGGKTSTKRSRPADRGRPLLAHHRAAELPSDRAPARGGEEDERRSTARGSWRSIAVAGADAFIAVFDAKYHYDFWRPITAIRNGDIDDNPATERDATWQPIDNTPMHPEYPCAHCIISGAVASVIEAVFGTADIPEVAMTSPTAPGVTHRWTNHARLCRRGVAGPHLGRLPLSVLDAASGQDMGRKIGEYVVKNLMQPVTTSGRALIDLLAGLASTRARRKRRPQRDADGDCQERCSLPGQS